MTEYDEPLSLHGDSLPQLLPGEAYCHLCKGRGFVRPYKNKRWTTSKCWICSGTGKVKDTEGEK